MSNTRKTKPDVARLLAAARLPERTVELCLRGDLQAQRELLQQEITQARAAAKSADRSLGDQAPEVAELEAALDAVEVEMRDAVLTITLRALNPAEVTLLQVEHPPTDDDKAKGLAVDWETYRVGRIRASIVDPVLTDTQWDRLLEVITLGQRTLLEDTVEVLNHSVVDVPFSSAASRRIQPSDGS